MSPVMRTIALASLFALGSILVACGGRVAGTDSSGNPNGPPTPAAGSGSSGSSGSGSASGSAQGSGGGSLSGGSDPGAPSTSPSDPGPQPSAGAPNACSMQPLVGSIGAGELCDVAVDVKSDGSFASLVMAHGDDGVAWLDGSTLSLSCSQSGVAVMRAVIGCYQGPGTYTIPAGALVLGAKTSDRACRLDADVEGGQVRGFIDCGPQEDGTTNLFANTTAPIGLGAYALPLPTK